MNPATTTSIVPVEFTDRAATALRWAGEVSVTDESSLALAVEGGGRVTRALRDAEELRDTMVRPLNDRVKAINAAWKEAREPFERAKRTADGKIADYQAAKRRAAEAEAQRRREEEERAARAAAEAEAEARRKIAEAEKVADTMRTAADLDAAIAAEEAAKKAAAEAAAKAAEAARAAEVALAPVARAGPVRTDGGTMSSRVRWTFRVVDAAAVPREFLEVSDRLVRAAVAGGTREIPGVQVYAEEQVTYR